MKYNGIPAVIIFLHIIFLLSKRVTTNLVDDTCNQTTHAEICTNTLRSHPESSSADLRGLAIIMVNATIAIGNETLGQVQSLLQEPAVNKTTRELLKSCEKLYTLTVSKTLPRARAEINYGAYELANEDIEYARDTPSACEYGFIREAIELPLKENDLLMGDLTDLCLELVNLLMKNRGQ